MSGGILRTDYVPREGIGYEDYLGTGSFFWGNSYTENRGNFLYYMPNPDFKLESAKKFNVGVDVGLLDGLTFQGDVYYQRRSDILLQDGGLNSQVIGLPPSYVNWGIVDSKGVELGLNYTKRWKEWTVSAGGLFSYGTSQVKKWIETPAYPYLSIIGHPVNQAFGLEAVGFFKDQAEIDDPATPKHEFDFVSPGDIRYKDQNKDGVINENDAIAMGTPYPEINYSLSFGIEYKGVGINLLFQGTGKHTKFLTVPGVFRPMNGNTGLSEYYLANCWQPEAPEAHVLFPRLSTEDSPNNYRNNDVWLADASFLKLRNCEVYYNFPASLLKRMSANDAINVLRDRPDIQMPYFTGNTNFEERYRRERMVELAFEDHRFWDIRRWKIGEVSVSVKTMTLKKGADDDIILTRGVLSRQWNDKYYLYPIPYTERVKNPNLEQNPGWEN